MCPRHLHVELSDEEYELLVKLRGKRKWKGWLLSIPSLLREKSDETERLKLELRVEKAERELENLTPPNQTLEMH